MNADGVLDAGDHGAAGRVVYVDLEGSGQDQPADPCAVTDANGNYTITGLTPGIALTVREVVPAGMRQTAAPSSTVTLSAGQTATVANFATTQILGGLRGTVFNDLDGNGVLDPGEPGLAGRMVYVDLDGSGQYKTTDPSAITDANGNYTINGLTPGGAVIVREAVPAGMRETTAPASAVTIVPSEIVTVADFATTQIPAAVTGRSFDDTNGNGVQDAGEASVAGLLVYVDLDGSGKYESNDPSAVTDANGNYAITGLAPGVPLIIDAVIPSDMRQTAAPAAPLTLSAGQTLSGADFGITQTALIRGVVVLKDIPDTPALSSPNGFELILTQHPLRGKVKKFISFTNPDGTFAFNGIEPDASDTLQLVKRKGFKLAPHSRDRYKLRISDGEVANGIVFSQVPVFR